MPAVNPDEFAVTVTVSNVFPEALLVRLEEESDDGETDSHVAVEGVTLADHVRVEPGDPVLLTFTCVVAELPAVEFNVTAVGLAPIPAIGYQYMMKATGSDGVKVCGLADGKTNASAVDPNIPCAKESIVPTNPPVFKEAGDNFIELKAY